MKIIFTIFLSIQILTSHLISSFQTCNYFDLNFNPVDSNCDIIYSNPSSNLSNVQWSKLQLLSDFISNSSIHNINILYRGDLILSKSKNNRNISQVFDLPSPFQLSISTLIFSSSVIFSEPPYSMTIRKLSNNKLLSRTPLREFLSLSLLDPFQDILWYGPNVSSKLSFIAIDDLNSLIEGFTGVSFRKALMQMNSFFGFSDMRFDQVKGDYVLRGSPRDLLRVSRVIVDVMMATASNFTSTLSNFPLHSKNLMRVARKYQYGWWINGASFNNDNSNLISAAPGDLIASIDCKTRLYIVPSWELSVLVQRDDNNCPGIDWLEEDKMMWLFLKNSFEFDEEQKLVSRYSLHFTLDGFDFLNQILFFSLYVCIGHVVTFYFIRILWDICCVFSKSTLPK